MNESLPTEPTSHRRRGLGFIRSNCLITLDVCSALTLKELLINGIFHETFTPPNKVFSKLFQASGVVLAIVGFNLLK
jgi:hypothetical protein